MPKTTIETLGQFMQKYREIMNKTGWTEHRLAKEAAIVPQTLRKITSGDTANPGREVCNKMATLADRVRRMK